MQKWTFYPISFSWTPCIMSSHLHSDVILLMRQYFLHRDLWKSTFWPKLGFASSGLQYNDMYIMELQLNNYLLSNFTVLMSISPSFNWVVEMEHEINSWQSSGRTWSGFSIAMQEMPSMARKYKKLSLSFRFSCNKSDWFFTVKELLNFLDIFIAFCSRSQARI